MDNSRKFCHLCLTETDFNVPLFGSYCRKANMIDKILVCLNIVIEETDNDNTICFKCASNVEKYHDFIMFVRKSHAKLGNKPRQDFQTPKVSPSRQSLNGDSPKQINRRVTAVVREQVFDADYTFSFLEMPEEKNAQSSPFFSYFSPTPKQNGAPPPWQAFKNVRSEIKTPKPKKQRKMSTESRDLFESQSQNDSEPKSLDWKFTPNENNIMKRLREKCFGPSDF